MDIENLLGQILPDPARARETAALLRKDHPELSPAELVRHALHSAKIRAAIAGAATGAASSPLTMIPAALADMAAVLRIEGALVGVVAALLDPAALDDPHAIRADVLSILFPAAASQALRQLGIRAAERLSQAAMRKYATEDLLRTIMRLASRYVGKRLTRETIVAHAIPLVGIGLGAGWNWLEVQAIGNRAIRYYNDEVVRPTTHIGFRSRSKALPKVARFLPYKGGNA